MKILIISQYFYPEQFRVSDVAFRLAALGHEVTVLTGLPNYPSGRIFKGYEWKVLKSNSGGSGKYEPKLDAFLQEINGVNVIRCKLYPRKKGKLNLARNYISFAYHSSILANSMVKAGYEFDKILLFQYSPVTMALPGILLSKKLKIPLFFYCFDLWPESIVSAGLPNRGFVYSILLYLSRWLYNKADMILISSKNFRGYFHNKLRIYSDIKYLPIYAEDVFTRSADTYLNDIDSDSSENVNLLFAGNVGEMQSVETIIKAADLLRNRSGIHFHIVGDGSSLEKNVHLAKILRLTNITFHGRFPLDEMPKFYSMADAFLVTLKKDAFISYTLPGKVQSYMASGKPILASIDGEAFDVINESGCGLCCEAENFEAFSKIIIQFAEEKIESRRKYGDSAKTYYNNNFSAESFMRSLLNILG